jgi:hypothetical protein
MLQLPVPNRIPPWLFGGNSYRRRCHAGNEFVPCKTELGGGSVFVMFHLYE